MTTTQSRAAAAARIGAGLGRRKRAELLGLLRPCFVRVEPWLQAGRYAGALMSQIPRRNGWTIAEHAGDRTPEKTQRPLNRACWDTFAATAVVRRFAVAGPDEAARRAGRRGLAVGAVDETGQVKQGEHTAGVKRHYLGCAGKVANGITTVHLAYVREQAGHALIAARQWIPREHAGDLARQQIMGLPDDLVFRTKGQLAIDLLTEVFADGVRLDFVCGDEVYGSCTQLREYLEGRGQGYVLRVPSNFHLTVARGVKLSCKQAAAHLLAGDRRWEVRSAGKGSKGERWYAWAWLATISARHYLLIPPPPRDRRAGLSLLSRAPGPAAVTVPADPCRRAALASRGEFPVQQCVRYALRVLLLRCSRTVQLGRVLPGYAGRCGVRGGRARRRVRRVGPYAKRSAGRCRGRRRPALVVASPRARVR